MKIYNRKGFINGLISLSICIVGVAAIILKGFSVKLSIIIPILFIYSIVGIRRSLLIDASREDIIENEDERVKYISLKTAGKSLELLKVINMIVIILSMLSYAFTKNIFLLGIFILSSIYFTLSFIIELAANIYYEKHE